jgi:hypothetical protein
MCQYVQTLYHMRFLELEVEILESRFREHDTGNLRTAVSVLKTRIKEIENIIRQRVESKY